MTRRTLKGGLFKGFAKGTAFVGSKLAKKTEKGLIGENGTRKMFASYNPKTFMGQNLSVHAFSLKEVAEKVFEFAKKYEKYSRICKKDKNQCLTDEDIKKDRAELIRHIKETLPPNDEKFYIKDPRKGYKYTNTMEILRKEDFLFLFRLNLLLKKWEQEPDVAGILALLDKDYVFIKGIADNTTKNKKQPFMDMTVYQVKVDNKIVNIMKKDTLFSFKFEELDHKDKIKEFNERYADQYEAVVNSARDSKAEATESVVTSEVQTYVEGIKDKPVYIGKKYTLKRLDKGFSIEPNPA